jgi:hypothetical protein
VDKTNLIGKGVTPLIPEPIAEFLAKTDCCADKKLGSGKLGTVYRLKPKGALKITEDRKEACLAVWQFKKRLHGLPRITGVLAYCSDRSLGFAIARERADDIAVDKPTLVGAILLSHKAHSQSNLEKKNWNLSQNDHEVVMEAIGVKDELSANGVSPGDFHVENLGRTSSGKMVLRDMGSCSLIAGDIFQQISISDAQIHKPGSISIIVCQKTS